MSDWIERLAEPAAPAAQPPDWLARLGAGEGDGAPAAGEAFREALPFGEPRPAPPPPPPAPLPEPPAVDPAAEAQARAYAEGEAAGRAAARAEAEARAARQRALRLAFRALDEAALGVLAEDLAATVIALCEAVLGKAALDPAGILARCEAAARRIGGASDALALHLHPEDIAVLGETALAGWRVVPDAGLERGTVLLEGPEGTAGDGPAEWRRAIAAAVRG